MTCREKLAIEHPEHVTDEYVGGCACCPHTFKYMPRESGLCHKRNCNATNAICRECWDQELPEEKIDLNAIIDSAINRIKNSGDQVTPDTEPTTQEPDTTPSESTEQKTHIPSMTDLQWMMRKALGYPGIAVSITFMEDVVTFNAYPYPIQDEPEGEHK